MGYWMKVVKRLAVAILVAFCSYLAFKLAIFYIPFLIAFLIASMLEPLIRLMMRKTKFSRRLNSIIIVSITLIIIIGIIVWMIVGLVNEAQNLLQKLNEYFDKISSLFERTIAKINFDKIKGSEQLSTIIKNSGDQFLNTISVFVKNFLTKTLETITSIPKTGVYVVITLLATVFICIDRVYILDTIEHHLPEIWAKKIGIHIKRVLTTLSKYLKAELTMVFITFIQVLIGLYIMDFLGFKISYPLLAALAVGFVDALPIVRSRQRVSSMGSSIWFEWKFTD